MASFRPSICLIFAAVLTVTAVASAHAEDKTLLRAREGAAAMFRGQFEKAVGLYDEALSTPEISDFVQASIYSDRGIAKWRLKQTNAAIIDFNQSIQLSPEEPSVYNNRGNAYMDLGRFEEALKDFDRAIVLSPSYGVAYNNRGNAYAALGQYTEAFQSFRKAAGLLPQNPIPFNGRGRSHAELARYHAAVRDLTRAISLDQKYAAAYSNRAEANFAIAKYSAAAGDVTEAVTLEPDLAQPNLLLLRARAYSAENKFKEAIADFDKALELNGNLIDAYVERGALFAKNRRYDDAIGDYTRALQLDGKNAKAYALRGEAKLKLETPGDALVDVNQALSLSLGDPLALRIRGNIYEVQERVEDAVVDYGKALGEDPFQVESRQALVRLKQEVPVATGQPLGEAVAGWVITEPSPGRYLASNPDYGSLRVELEMFGAGKPQILEWKLMRGALAGTGLLKYYAGDFGEGALEYVAIVDTRANKVVSIEPKRWGDKAAQWNWQAVSVVVTDPDGQANEIKLRRAQTRRAPVKKRRKKGGSDNVFDWMFR